MTPRLSASSDLYILALPGFDLFDLSALVDTFASLNRLNSSNEIRIHTVSLDEGSVISSSGVLVSATPLHFSSDLSDSLLVVLAGAATSFNLHKRAGSLLAEAYPSARYVGSVSYGVISLLEAGLLDAATAVVPWQALDNLAHRYKRTRFSLQLFHWHNRLFTSCGGAGALDLALSLTDLYAEDAAREIADHFNCARIRNQDDLQPRRDGVALHIENPALHISMTLMQKHVEMPLPLPDIVTASGVDKRQLQRLFKTHIGTTPTEYYQELRLRHARSILRETTMPVAKVAASIGFRSPSHFTRSYKGLFGCLPKQDRQTMKSSQFRADVTTLSPATHGLLHLSRHAIMR